MWVCRKCHKQASSAGKICRACGGILEEMSDDGGPGDANRTESEVTASRSVSRSLPDGEPEDTFDLVAEEEGPEMKPAGKPWKCPRCGEMVPGNFDVCWQCSSDKAGESPPEDEGRLPADEINVSMVADPNGEAETEDKEPGELGKCLRCGSTKIMRGLTVLDQGEGSAGKLQTVVFGNPEALVFKDRLFGELTADICGECGHVELRVVNPESLYQHYEKSHAPPRSRMSESETEMTWEMKRLLRKAGLSERRGEYEEAIGHLERFIATTDNEGNIELARSHIRRIQKRLSNRSGEQPE
jgi:hypothetical protein